VNLRFGGIDGPVIAPTARAVLAALWIVAALLALQGGYKLVSGTAAAWGRDKDIDLQYRANEYAWFREGVYPNANVEPPPDPSRASYSVYPPYAFPMMAVFFEPWGLEQGRIVLWTLSVAGLLWLAIAGCGTLGPWGAAMAALGAAAALGISGNKGVFGLGQFSILCVALIFLQMSFITRGRPVAAGLCWALAMLKPHIALPFAALFLFRRQTVGLVTGLALLAALSWLACAWTGVAIGDLIQHWTSGMSFQFARRGFSVGPGALAVSLGLDHRVVVAVVFGVLLAAVAAASLAARRLGPEALLSLAGLCGGVGMLGVYHWLYDQIMLLPMLLATLVAAAAARRPIAIIVAAAPLVSLTVPTGWLEGRRLPEAIVAAIWAVAAVYPLGLLIATRRRTEFACT